MNVINRLFKPYTQRNGISRILALSLLLVMLSCSNSGTNKNNEVKTVQDTATVGIDYLLPTPEELISNLADNNFIFQDKNLINIQISSNANLTRYKALYFGVTYSDFLYLSYFNKGYKALNYLKALKKLSTELGITSRLNDEYLARMENNLTNVDSLKIISIELSIEVFKNIEYLGGKELYAQIGIGTIVEALFLATQSIDKIEGHEQLVSRVVEMGQFFDNYMENYAQYKPKDEAADQLFKDLNSVKNGFYKLNVNTQKLEVEKSSVKDSMAHLTFVKKINKEAAINNDKFLELKHQIEQVRANIIGQKILVLATIACLFHKIEKAGLT